MKRYNKDSRLSSFEKKLLYGALLGDASVTRSPGKSTNARIKFVHGIAQIDYLLWKKENAQGKVVALVRGDWKSEHLHMRWAVVDNDLVANELDWHLEPCCLMAHVVSVFLVTNEHTSADKEFLVFGKGGKARESLPVKETAGKADCSVEEDPHLN